jgi:plastocyanin
MVIMSITTPQGARPDLPNSDVDERFEAISRDLSSYRVSRDGWTILVFALAAAAAIFSIVGMGLALRNDGGGGGGASAAPTVDAHLTEFAIELSSAQIGAGGTITVHNGGTTAHDLAVRTTELTTGSIEPGATATLDVSDLEPGTYELICTIPGHVGSGMTTTLVIGDGATAAPAAAGAHSGHDVLTPEQGAIQDAAMIESVMEFPAATEGHGNAVLEPEILPDGTKHFELTASIVDWEVAPGEIVQAWAYNGIVPGPRIDVEVGDTVEFELTNDLPIGTDIHWHGIDVPNEMDGVAPITQELVESGSTFTYRFTVTEPAIGMYHAHAHGHVAIPNGLFGTFYAGTVGDVAGTTISGIDVPADLDITQDIPMVVNDAGVIGLTLNGKSFPATEPVVVTEGDWIRITYFNEGLQAHPMHLHGFEQLVIAKDGEPLDAPYAADTILVGPGERYTVLVHADVAGTWVWHCHILNHVESDDGMFGMVTALVVEPA